MTKYSFHPDLKACANMKIPLKPWLIPSLQKMMKVLYLLEKDDKNVKIKRLHVQDKDGYAIPVLVYEPNQIKRYDSCMIYFHGGGFAFQGAPHHFKLARTFAKELQCPVYFVDYRLAPKHPFPYAIEDSFAVYQWLSSHYSSIVVAGDSAGGNIATVMSMMAYDYHLPLPKVQILLYPFVDRRMITNSMSKYPDTPMCNSNDMKKYLDMYASCLENHPIEYLSPMEREHLDFMPTTYIEVAEFDCLHDEGIEYALKLKQQGVQVELHEAKEAMHGYDFAFSSDYVQTLMKQRIEFLNKHF